MHSSLTIIILFVALCLLQIHAYGPPQNYNYDASLGPAPRTSKAGYHTIGGSVYYIVDNATMAWYDAAKYCNALGLTLASLETEEESTAVLQYLEDQRLDVYPMWTSGAHMSGAGWLWTSTGLVFGPYTLWEENQPDQEIEPCVALYLQNGAWWDYGCYYPIMYFLCEE